MKIDADVMEKAREASIKIWGEWKYDHEYGDRKDRAKARALHDSRVDHSTELIAQAIQEAKTETARDCAEIASHGRIDSSGMDIQSANDVVTTRQRVTNAIKAKYEVR